MEEVVAGKASGGSAWARLGQALAVVAAAPFLAGAAVLWWTLGHLPGNAAHLAKAQILGAALFAFGIGLGVIGAAFTLLTRTVHRRILCTALTLFGLSHLLLGFYVSHATEAAMANSQTPVLPAVIPVALWAYSVLLALKTPRIAAAHKAKAAEEVKEEQPQPLSQP